MLAAALLLSLLIFDGNTRIVTDTYTVSAPALPDGFDGMRILQLSDLHGAVFGRENEYLLHEIRAAEPEVIFLTGDLADSPGQKEDIRSLIPRLCAIAPVYFVTGNHDWTCGWTDELLAMLEGFGVTVLQNEWVTLYRKGDSLVLAGAEDPNGPADMMTPEELVNAIVRETGSPPAILLNHRNDRLELYASLGVPLVLSGHAHGGVIRLPGIGGLFGHSGTLLPENEAGLCLRGNTVMTVSRGIGNIRGTFRLFNNPQLLCLVLETK